MEGLFLPIFRGLKKKGIVISCLQFTWGDPAKSARVSFLFNEAGLNYDCVIIRKHFGIFGLLLAIVTGVFHLRKMISKNSFDAVMPRSILPGLIALFASCGYKVSLIFDADGLPLDERVDFLGKSNKALHYRVLRDIENQIILKAQKVLTRTSAAVDILYSRGGAGIQREKFHIVKNGRCEDAFTPISASERRAVRELLGLNERLPLIVYCGSLGEQYCCDEMLCFFEYVLLSRSDAKFLILTEMTDIAHKSIARRPNLMKSIFVKSVSAVEIPRYLAACDLGLAFRRKSFSTQAVSPVKLGEYLLCGLPIVATDGVGDTAKLTRKSAYLVNCMNEIELKDAANWFCQNVMIDREAFLISSRLMGQDLFSLDKSIDSYFNAFSHLIRSE